MTDLIAIASSGVRAYQAALAQTGDNVANADTEGYSRRIIKIRTGPSGAGTPFSRIGSGGSGAVTGPVTRAGDALKTNAARVASGDHARFSSRSEWLQRLQSIVGGSGIDQRLAGFFDAASDLATAPTSVAARTVFLDRADQAASGFRNADANLAVLADDLASATAVTTAEINDIASGLARVNDELRRTQGGDTAANALLDSRDRLLAELADRVRVSVTEGAQGVVTVRIGNGGAAAVLVPATGNATRIGVRDSGSGAEILLDPGHLAAPIKLPASGRLSGLIEASRQVATSRSDIDQLATRFADGVNAWHRNGSDALGAAGGDLFATGTIIVTPGKANAGAGPVDIVIADGASLAPDGYQLLREASGWTLARTDGSASVSIIGGGPATLSLDGLDVRVGAGAASGDSFALALHQGAAGIALRSLGPERLAVADQFISDASSANAGDGRLNITPDVDAAGFLPAAPYRVTVTGPGVGTISDIATGTVLAALVFDGSEIAGAGFHFTMTGNPVTGDSFRILATAAGSSDNGNIRALAGLRAAAGVGGTLEGSFDASTAGLGSRLAESDRLVAAALAVKDDTAKAADAVSGVDLDREAAELTRLQMAYRANAQVIAAARDLFDAILSLVR